MLNLDDVKPQWLASDQEVVSEFKRAVSFVRKVYAAVRPGAMAKGEAAGKLRNAFSYGVSFNHWSLLQIEEAYSFTTRDSSVKLGDIDSKFTELPASYNSVMSSFLKMVFIALWARKILVTALDFQTVTSNHDIFDHLCVELNVECLSSIRGLHPLSSLPSQYKRAEANDNSSRVNFWIRTLFCTTFYTLADVEAADCQELFDNAYGTGEKRLRRYYVKDFLLMLTKADPGKSEVVNCIFGAYDQARETELELAKQAKEEQRIAEGKSRFSSVDESYDLAAKISNSGEEFNFQDILKTYFTPNKLKRIFDLKTHYDYDPIYKSMHPAVQDFVMLMNALFRSFIKSKKLLKEHGHVLVLNLLLSYLACFLPNFIRRRDGSLNEHPKGFEALNCTILFTRQHIFVDGVLNYEKEPPPTFLTYMDMYAKAQGWHNDTHYARVLVCEDFCTYIQDNRNELKGAESFVNNFTASCFPVTQRRTGTVKKIIPRDYFATFLSMLYSLEYLVMHINDMAVGRNCGILNGRLCKVNIYDLQDSHAWSGLMSKHAQGANGIGMVNLDLVNYCPIFFHAGKIYRMTYVPRFFTLMDYEVSGTLVKRISPSQLRVTIAMCETGLRQHHIVWLDKDRFDCVMDKYSKSQLAPLFVNSDKSHGEWTAIVARHVMRLFDRQRDFYNECSFAHYNEDIWYGGVEGAKFGKYKPLFRGVGDGRADALWKNYKLFPVYLLMLQYFIRETMGDTGGDALVYYKNSLGGKMPVDDYSVEFLNKVSRNSLSSPHTPHALRAGFVSEAIRFLPPSIIGQFMTGQTEELVWYYAIFDGKNMPDHQKLLADYLQKNMQALGQGEAPELAKVVMEMNARLMSSIRKDPVKAVQDHGLVSLTGVKESESGVEVLRAKRYTQLAFNNCHICPFGNHCPKEVVEQFGAGQPCALCPYAIRGVDHLRAISVEKDKAKEMMAGVLKHIKEHRALKKSSQNIQAIEKLNAEHDRHAREAFALEAIEQQLYLMAKSGQLQSLYANDKEGVVSHYQKIQLTEDEHLLKRLIDVQNFPDATSPELNTKFAYMRTALLVKESKIEELLKVDDRSPAHKLGSQIGSMLSSGALHVNDVLRIKKSAELLHDVQEPSLVIANRIGVSLRKVE
jgi:hypothetical protein